MICRVTYVSALTGDERFMVWSPRTRNVVTVRAVNFKRLPPELLAKVRAAAWANQVDLTAAELQALHAARSG